MAVQKILAFTLLATLLMLVTAEEHRNNFIVGEVVPKDYLLQRAEVKESPNLLGLRVKTRRTFEGTGLATISQIRALDQHPSGHGATASLIAGGIGKNFVTLEFESEIFRGVDFIVELYGKE